MTLGGADDDWDTSLQTKYLSVKVVKLSLRDPRFWIAFLFFGAPKPTVSHTGRTVCREINSSGTSFKKVHSWRELDFSTFSFFQNRWRFVPQEAKGGKHKVRTEDRSEIEWFPLQQKKGKENVALNEWRRPIIFLRDPFFFRRQLLYFSPFLFSFLLQFFTPIFDQYENRRFCKVET